MAKKISFSCWTKAENVERQDGHIFQAQSSSQSVHRFRVILPARGFSALLLGVHRLPVSVKASPDFYLRDQLFNTQYKTLSESVKSLSCFNASGGILLTCG